MPHGTPLDFGAASLRAVQELVGDPIEDHVTSAVAAYVGEALLRVAGAAGTRTSLSPCRIPRWASPT